MAIQRDPMAGPPPPSESGSGQRPSTRQATLAAFLSAQQPPQRPPTRPSEALCLSKSSDEGSFDIDSNELFLEGSAENAVQTHTAVENAQPHNIRYETSEDAELFTCPLSEEMEVDVANTQTEYERPSLIEEAEDVSDGSNKEEVEPPVQCTATDELYRLINRVAQGNTLFKGYAQALRDILTLLEDEPALAIHLQSSDFLNRGFLCALRAGPVDLCLQIGTLYLQSVRKAPAVFLSRPFLFFLANKLAITQEFTGMRANGLTSACILTFLTALVSVNGEAVPALYQYGFYTLSAALITAEACRFYSATFTEIVHPPVLVAQAATPRGHPAASTAPATAQHARALRPAIPSRSQSARKPITRDTAFEDHRRMFEPETILTETPLFVPRYRHELYKDGVFEKIYAECVNLPHMIEQDPLAMLDVLLYWPSGALSRAAGIPDQIAALVAQKVPKALAYYRRALEQDSLPAEGLVNALVQMLDNEATRLDAALALFYHADSLTGHRGFTEHRIRFIFQCLEFACPSTCPFNGVCDTSDAVSVGSLSSSCFQMPSSLISEPGAGFAKPADLVDSPFGDPIQEQPHAEDTLCNIHQCIQTRIVGLLRLLYAFVQPEYFYKPSHLILLRECMAHCKGEKAFIKAYFRDIFEFLRVDPSNVARMLFPCFKEKKVKDKFVEITLDEQPENDRNYNVRYAPETNEFKVGEAEQPADTFTELLERAKRAAGLLGAADVIPGGCVAKGTRIDSDDEGF